jgi:hypothetical protein
MRNLSVIAILGSCLFALSAAAQNDTPPFPVALEKELAARASKYTEVSMDKKMLTFAGKFLSKDEADDIEAKQIIDKLDGIYVREYDFDEPGQYTAADLELIRRQFKGSEWSPMVRERSKNGEGDSDIYMKIVDGKMQGMFVLDSESKELDMVYIAGTLDPSELSKLDGNFGIPKGFAAHTVKDGGK